MNARQNELVFITEEMFQQMVDHLSAGIRQPEMPQNLLPSAGAVPVNGGQPQPRPAWEWDGRERTEVRQV